MRSDLKSSFVIPFEPIILLLASLLSTWLLLQSDLDKILWGLGGLLIGSLLYFFMERNYKEALEKE